MANRPERADQIAELVDEASVQERLVAMIVDLTLQPGSVVSERNLLEELQTTKPLLRGAIKACESVGLVSVLPRIGVAISAVGLLDVQAVYEARKVLEPAVARLAAERATTTQRAQLQRRVTDIDVISRGGESSDITSSEFVELDRKVHMGIARAAGNAFLANALEPVLLANARIWNVFFAARMGEDRFFISHSEINAAILRGDPEGASSAARNHLEHSGRLLQGAFNSLLPEGEATS